MTSSVTVQRWGGYKPIINAQVEPVGVSRPSAWPSLPLHEPSHCLTAQSAACSQPPPPTAPCVPPSLPLPLHPSGTGPAAGARQSAVPAGTCASPAGADRGGLEGPGGCTGQVRGDRAGTV